VSVAIYSRLIELAALSPDDRAALKTKRGFSDETIDRFRFRSCGPDLGKIIDGVLKAEFQGSELVEAGVVTETLEPHFVLTKPNILIPYLDGDRVMHIRPHKYGIPEKAPQIYKAGTASAIVLTESEFKAAASHQFGFPAWGIPGISSFSRQHAPRFIETIKAAEITNVFIIFDNEKKDDPTLASYKQDPEKRWDTQFYAIVMAKNLEKAGISAKICTLPSDWMRDGKIDIDGALAQGRKPDEYKRVIMSGLPQKEYRYRQPKEAMQIIARKDKIWWRNPLVRKEFNRYVSTRTKGKESVDVDISNFTVSVRSNFYIENDGGANEITRSVVLTDEFGRESQPVIMTSEDMTSEGFADFAKKQGPYLWKGNKAEMDDVWEDAFLRDTGRIIYQPNHIGRMKDGSWLFGNVGINSAGELVTPDEEGIFWIDGKGYKPRGIGDTEPPVMETRYKVDIWEYSQKLAQCYGNQGVKAAIGWVLGSAYADDIHREVGLYPLLFIGGKKGSGKTTLARWLMKLAGRDEPVQSIGSVTTENAIIQRLKWSSCMPCFWDEFRNSKDMARREGLLRVVFNRGGVSKAIRTGDGLRSVTARGTVMLAGQDRPNDEAFFDRMIDINISEERRTGEHYKWLAQQSGILSSVYLDVIRRKKEFLPGVLAGIEKFAQLLLKRGAGDRTAVTYGVVASCYWTFCVPQEKPDIAFTDWLGTSSDQKTEEVKDDSPTTKFWDSVISYVDRGDIDKACFKRSGDGKLIYVYMRQVYDKWAECERRIGREPWNENAIIRYMDNEGYLHSRSTTNRFNGNMRRCIAIESRTAPKSLLDYMEGESSNGNGGHNPHVDRTASEPEDLFDSGGAEASA